MLRWSHKNKTQLCEVQESKSATETDPAQCKIRILNSNSSLTVPTISLDPINIHEPSNIPRTAADVSPDDLRAVLSHKEVDFF